MLELYKSSRFQEDYTKYKNQTCNISNPAHRARADKLLSSLVDEVKFLDKQHSEMFNTNKLPMRLDESKSKIHQIRRELDTLLRDLRS